MNGVLEELGGVRVLTSVLDLPSTVKDRSREVHGDDFTPDFTGGGETEDVGLGGDSSRQCLRGKHTTVGGEGCRYNLHRLDLKL